ncbi:IMPACT family protein [Fulvivirga sediminis]|uniref:YigZ family protein n=1 Tax=Fulvivirga sediminis TaxID=2803949 RepID=A0A937F7K6_9BACT|nr:YigZ family protein [Fulvivirga sediminis]MBL3656497.1 YigZ family protein [Fulvivirga sediminis]
MAQPVENFFTIEGSSEGLYKEKGSKFLAYAYHVKNEEEVKECLGQLKKQYHDARHHCYAYMLGAERKDFRANDDGEPNHSAGDPILGQINSKNLTDVLVVVVRYFGGTKLGVSGLINAYKVSAEEALANANILKVEVTKPIKITYSYEETNEVMKLVSDLSLEIVNQEFTMNCTMEAEVKINLLNSLKEKVQLLNDLGNNIQLNLL